MQIIFKLSYPETKRYNLIPYRRNDTTWTIADDIWWLGLAKHYHLLRSTYASDPIIMGMADDGRDIIMNDIHLSTSHLSDLEKKILNDF